MTTPQKPSKVFGGGDAYGSNNVDNSTPFVFDTIQDQSFSIKQDVKSLFGTAKFPADVSAGAMTVTSKITCASLGGRAFSDALFGSAAQSRLDRVAKRERHNIDNDETIKVANAAGFVQDLGVIDPSTNRPLVRVKVGDNITQNQYSCTAKGVYVVHSVWDKEDLDFSYLYTLDGENTSSKITMNNQEMGATGTFKSVQSFNWRDEQNVLVLNSCIMDSFEIASKQGDYAKPTWSFMACVDDYDVLGTLSLAQRR